MRSTRWPSILHSAPSARPALTALVVGLGVAIALPAWAHGPRCKRVSGKFTSAPAATCDSPVGMCTDGRLEGSLTGGYAFTMAQILPSGDDTIPTVSFFTGASTITFPSRHDCRHKHAHAHAHHKHGKKHGKKHDAHCKHHDHGGDDLLLGTDAGSIDLNPFGFGKFTTLITLIGGQGDYAGASGYLQIRGTLDFFTGGASGDYQGEVCTN